MTISTYSELKTAIANHANRYDLTSVIPDFITMGATRIFYGSKEAPFEVEPLRVRAMEYSADLTVNGQGVALPSSFLQVRRLYINSSTVRLCKFVAPDLFWKTYISTNTGIPQSFTIEGENLLFGPTPDTTYTGKILYYKKFAAFSGDSDTDWLLTNAPGAYLQAALVELHDYCKDFEAKENALKVLSGIINGLNDSDKADRYAGPWASYSDTGNP